MAHRDSGHVWDGPYAANVRVSLVQAKLPAHAVHKFRSVSQRPPQRRALESFPWQRTTTH